jgi:DNA-binding PadR family transcriptional regulator
MVTDGAVDLEEGSLYPALHRLERRGYLTSEFGPSEKNRRARHYQLTPAGRQLFRDESERWDRYAEMMDRVLRYGASGSIRGR